MNAACSIQSCLLFAAIVFFPISSWCADPDNPLLGCWMLQRVGARDATKLPIEVEWEFTEDTMIVRELDSSLEISRWSYSLDLTKEPKWINISIVGQGTEVRRGIFRIVGDELHLRQVVAGGVRPSDFPKDGYAIVKRQKVKGIQQDGAANRCKPIRSETSHTLPAAGSVR